MIDFNRLYIELRNSGNVLKKLISTILFFIISCYNLLYSQPCSNSVISPGFTYTQTCNTKTVNFTNTSVVLTGSVVSVNWNFGDGNNSNLSNPTYTYANFGTYLVTLTLTHSSGCSSVITDSVKVLPPISPDFTFNFDSVCPSQLISFTNLTVGNNLSYKWYFRDGPNYNAVSNTAYSPSHYFTNAVGITGTGYVTFDIKLEVIDNNGCIYSISKPLTLKQRPYIDFIEYGNFKRCQSVIGNTLDTAYIYNYSTVSQISSYEINWGNGSGFVPITTPFTNNIPVTNIYSGVNNYPIEIKATGNNGCISVFKDTFKILSIPQPDFTSLQYNSGCVPFTVFTVNNSSGITSNTLTYINWGDNVIDTLPLGAIAGDTLYHTYNSTTCINGNTVPFTIVMTTKNECGSPFKSYGPINAFKPPIADINTSLSSYCVGYPVLFQNLTIPNYCADNPRTFYTWDFGDTIISILAPLNNPTPNITRIFNQPGTYTVYLTAENNSPTSSGKPGCGSTIDSVTIAIYDADANFTFDTVCFGNPTHFTDLSSASGGTIISRIWDFGDGTTSTQTNPSHTYLSPGKYVVKLTITSSHSCTDYKIDTVTVNQLPNPKFSTINTCFGDTTVFQNTTIANSDSIVSFLWNFSTGFSSNIANPAYQFPSYGTFNVNLQAVNNKGCSKDTTIAVIIKQNPIASFYTDTVCSGYQRVFTSNSLSSNGGIAGYYWTMGDGNGVCFSSDTVYNYPGAGTYSVYLQVTDSFGCKDDTTKQIYLGAVPIADFSYSNMCFGSQTLFTNTSVDQGVPITQYYWNFGDGYSSTLINPSHTFTSLQNYNVVLTVSNINGCKDSIQKVISIDTLPKPNFVSNTVCVGDTTKFTNLSLSYSSSIISLLWNFGDGTTDTVYNPMHLYSGSGSYNVTLTVTDSKNCISDTTITVNVISPPNPDFTIQQSCIGIPVQFTPVFNNSAITVSNWSFGYNNDSSSLVTPTYTYPQTGNYTVSFKLVDNFGCKNDTSKTIYISQFPVANFKFDTVCFGDSTKFVDISNDNGVAISTWQWGFYNQGVSNDTNPVFFFNHAGFYQTSLVVTNIYGCSDSVIMLVKVDTTPIANFSVNNVCIGNSVQFNDLSSTTGSPIIYWSWNFGNGDSANIQNPQYLYQNSGNYNVSLSVKKSNGCSKDTTQIVKIYPLPSPDFTTSSACEQNQIYFYPNDTLAFLAYWNFGDGSVDSSLNPNHTYINSGIYQIYLKVTDSNYCVSDTIKSLFVSPLPTAQFISDTVCSGNSTSFTNLSQDNGYSIVSYNWDFGDSSFSQNINPGHLYLQAGLYNAMLKVTNINGCIDSVFHSVQVDTLPFVDFTSNNSCLNDSITFTDISIANSDSISTWLWNFGNNDSSYLQNPVYQYNFNGTYQVTLNVTNSKGCKNQKIKQVNVFPLPVANFGFDTVCKGSVVNFYDSSYSVSSNINQWNWNFGDSIGYSQQQNPSYVYNTQQLQYNVTLMVVDTNLCKSSVTKNIVMRALPVANFYANIVCSGFPTLFTDSSYSTSTNISNWQWNFGDNTPFSNSQNPQHQYPIVNSITTYYPYLKVTDNYGCVDSIQKTVNIFPPVKADFISDTACNNSLVNLVDNSLSQSSPIVSWEWNFGNGDTVYGQVPFYAYSNVLTTSLYNVVLKVTDSLGCKDTVYHPVLIYPQPVVNFKADTSCLGFNTIFTDLSYSNGGALTSWNWNFGGTGTSNYKNTSHVFPNWGIYNTVLTVTDTNGCSNSITKPILVDSLPEANFSFSGNCASGLINFYDNTIPHGAPNVSWLWNFGNSYISTQQNPIHYYQNIGTYNVTLTVTNGNGCYSSISKPVYVNPSLNYTFTADTVCLGMATQFIDSFVVQTTQIVARYWNFGDGTTSTIQNPQHVYSNSGVYNVALTVLDTNGCVETIQKAVKVDAKPIADFNFNTACLGDTTIFTNTSFSATTVNYYYWNFGDGNTSTLLNPKHKYQNSGNYWVKLIITNSNGCIDSIVKQVSVLPVPSAYFSTSDVCSGFPAIFIDSSFGNGSYVNSWIWSFGDGDSLIINNPSQFTPTVTHSYQNPGIYNVSLKIGNNACSNTFAKNIEIYPTPKAGFIVQNQCLNDTTIFTDTSSSTAYPINQWQWSFGDNTFGNAQHPQHIYGQSGNYVIILKVTDTKGCNNTVSKNLVIQPLPIANFNYSQTCFHDSTYFTDLSFGNGSSIVGWDWNFGDLSLNSTQQNPVHYYSNPKNYSVNLKITNSWGCKNSISLPVVVDSLPKANFINSSTCLGNQTIFTNTSIGYGSSINQWQWNFGDGSGLSFIQNPVHSYQNPGIYPVKLLVKNIKGCSDSIVKPVQIDTLPFANFKADTVCLGFATHFTNLSYSYGNLALSYLWNFGDNTPNSNAVNPIHTYSNPGNYTVTLTVTDANGCSKTVQKNVVVNNVPIAGFNAPPTVFPSTTVFTNTSVGNPSALVNWNWNFGDGIGFSNQQNPSYNYAAADTYNVRLIVTDVNGCKDTVVKPVIVYILNQYIIADFTFNNACFNSPVYFTDSSVIGTGMGILSWNWDFGDNTYSNIQNPVHYYSSAGNYQVRLIVNGIGGVSDTIVKTVSIFNNPVADFDNSGVCLGVAKTFTDLSTVVNGNIIGWDWNFGNGNSANGLNHSIIYNSLGNFNVQLVVTSDNGCIDTIIKTVKVNPLPAISFSSDIVEGCPPLFITFTDSSVVDSGFIVLRNWNFGNGSTINSNQNQVSTTYLISGTYSVTLNAVSNSGCSSYMTIPNMITVYPMPVADFFADPSMTNIIEPRIQFIDNSTNAAFWSWDFDDGFTSTLQSPVHNYQFPGDYYPLLKVTTVQGCSDTISKRVVILKNASFYAPNAFSPNNDGYNDIFQVYGYNIENGPFEMLIFSRFGDLIYSTKDYNKGWDGTYKDTGSLCPEGVYVWRVTYTDGMGRLNKATGHVTLIK